MLCLAISLVHSIKLKLEFAVLGKLVQLVTTNPGSSHEGPRRRPSSACKQQTPKDMALLATSIFLSMATLRSERTINRSAAAVIPRFIIAAVVYPTWVIVVKVTEFPDFFDPNRATSDVAHAAPFQIIEVTHLYTLQSRFDDVEIGEFDRKDPAVHRHNELKHDISRV